MSEYTTVQIMLSPRSLAFKPRLAQMEGREGKGKQTSVVLGTRLDYLEEKKRLIPQTNQRAAPIYCL